MAVYRVIIVFNAEKASEAKAKAEAATKAAAGKLDRLTERRETWGAVSDEK